MGMRDVEVSLLPPGHMQLDAYHVRRGFVQKTANKVVFSYQYFLSKRLLFAYTFPDVAASGELLYSSRSTAVRPYSPSNPLHPSPNISSAVRPTLQTLAPIQSSTSFSAYHVSCGFVQKTANKVVFSDQYFLNVLFSLIHFRTLLPRGNFYTSADLLLFVLLPIQSSTSFSQYIYILLFVPLSRHYPHPVLYILLPINLLLFVPLSRH